MGCLGVYTKQYTRPDRHTSHCHMQVLEGDEEAQAVGYADLGRLLSCLEAQLAGGANFEFCQALLGLTLQVRNREHHVQAVPVAK